MKPFLYALAILLVLMLISAGFLMLYISNTDYRPDARIQLNAINYSYPRQDSLNEIVLGCWNIGYGGLGAEMDFFYDGGARVRPSKQTADFYFSGILKNLKRTDVDIWFLQEIDRRSKRSYRLDQYQQISDLLEGYNHLFAYNYKVAWVPVPVTQPMGEVNAGLATFSRYPLFDNQRWAYPLIADWPERLFLLDRCFIESRLDLKGEQDLYLLNTHNSAYVYDADKRKQELDILFQRMNKLDEMGHLVIAGGDWNMSPPLYIQAKMENGYKYADAPVSFPPEYLTERWKMVFYPGLPTNRSNDTPFSKGKNLTTIIDFYIVSAAFHIDSVWVADMTFAFSDHQPVFAKLSR